MLLLMSKASRESAQCYCMGSFNPMMAILFGISMISKSCFNVYKILVDAAGCVVMSSNESSVLNPLKCEQLYFVSWTGKVSNLLL